MVIDRSITTTLGQTYAYDQVGHVHQLMGDGKLPEGNVAALVQAPHPGLTDVP